jgi:inosose dehydratase
MLSIDLNPFVADLTIPGSRKGPPMDRSFAHSRRSFVKLGASAAALSTLGGFASSTFASAALSEAGDPWLGLKMGIATYSFSKLKLDAAIEGIKRVDLHYASIKDAHLSLKSTTDERKAVAKKFKDAGITLLSCGNISPGNDESNIRNVFEYARDAGIPTIVCSPTKASLPTLEKFVKEFDVKIAIHNHGPEDKIWPSPFDAWEGVQSFDERMGLCIDVGHTARCGVDPIAAIRKCASRLHDLHIKDIAVASGSSKPVELGRGVLDLHGILQALLDVKYAGHVGLEFEKNLNDPIPGTCESIGYLKGVLSGMKRA